MRSRPLGAAATALLVLLCLSWGFQQVAVKLALPAVPPMVQMAVRSAGACLLVLAWCASTGHGRIVERDGTLAWGLLAGALFAAEFVLIYTGLQWTGASRGAVFIYTAPFFVALGAHWLLPAERFGPAQWLGLVACFVGVAVALGAPPPTASARATVGDLMMLAAGALWAATTLVIKASPLRRASGEKVLVYQLAVSALAGGVGAVLLGERIDAAAGFGTALGALLYQTVWVAGVTYLLWFRLLRLYPAGPLQAGTSMTPVFGVLAAHLVLGEPITPGLAAAAALVAGGLVLVNLPGTRPLRRARQRPGGFA